MVEAIRVNISANSEKTIHIFSRVVGGYLETDEVPRIVIENIEGATNSDMSFLSGKDLKLGLLGEHLIRLRQVSSLEGLIQFFEENKFNNVLMRSNRMLLSTAEIEKIISELRFYQELVKRYPRRLVRNYERDKKAEKIAKSKGETYQSPPLDAIVDLVRILPTTFMQQNLAVVVAHTNEIDGYIHRHLDPQHLDLGRFAIELGRDDARRILDREDYQKEQQEAEIYVTRMMEVAGGKLQRVIRRIARQHRLAATQPSIHREIADGIKGREFDLLVEMLNNEKNERRAQ